MSTTIYYVYALYSSFRPDMPFYIGKGKGRRLYDHIKPSRIAGSNSRAAYIANIFASGGLVTPIKLFENMSEVDAHNKEIELIKHFGRVPKGPLLNFTDGGEGTSGYKLSQETKDKIKQSQIRASKEPDVFARRSAAIKKSHARPEVKEKLKLARAKQVLTPEYRASLSAGITKRNNSPEYKAKMRTTMRGRKLSVEHIAAISKGNTGKKRSDETRAKMGPICANNSRSDTAKAKNRAAHLGKKHTEETRRKMSIAKSGKPKSPEWAAKISASNIRTKALKRMLREGKCK